MSGVTGPKFRLRWSQLDGAEMRCQHCGEWWSIDPEFWVVGKWAECRVCLREKGRLYQALRRLDPEYAEAGRTRVRRYKNQMRRLYPDLLRAYEREVQARRRERLRERRAA